MLIPLRVADCFSKAFRSAPQMTPSVFDGPFSVLKELTELYVPGAGPLSMVTLLTSSVSSESISLP